MDSSLLYKGEEGASSVMRDQRRLNEIDSQVLIPQSFVTSVHALKHLCYHARHHDLHEPEEPKKRPGKKPGQKP
ncbi:hypothetical protein [Pseudomonas putida]|uniref:hypothetical protein n=1 Tax=Pseudomonas TaxID=286 RepID=UPI001074FA46|nr:hypothetical protein [Pseudomonas putida]MCG3645708.1 hypothetical protein [Pseudomonas putida]TFW19402.1 hypothetical protein E4L40_23780 [Pseudomonas putida]